MVEQGRLSQTGAGSFRVRGGWAQEAVQAENVAVRGVLQIPRLSLAAAPVSYTHLTLPTIYSV